MRTFHLPSWLFGMAMGVCVWGTAHKSSDYIEINEDEFTQGTVVLDTTKRGVDTLIIFPVGLSEEFRKGMMPTVKRKLPKTEANTAPAVGR